MATFYDFQRQFPDDEACLKHMLVQRFGGTETECPKCGTHAKFYRMKRERAYECQHCRYQLHPTAGTFMHRSHLPLHKWFSPCSCSRPRGMAWPRRSFSASSACPIRRPGAWAI